MSTLRRLPQMTRAGISYLRGDEQVSYAPLYYWIEPTSACNLRCMTCPTGRGLKRKTGMMEWDVFTKIIDQIASTKPVINLHHSGESTLHPRLADMTAHIRGNGGFVGYFTNATRLDDNLIETILDSPPHWLGFSFDGYTPETFEAIRVGGKWDQIMGNIVRFLQARAKRSHGGRRAEPYTYMSIVELPDLSRDTDPATKRAFAAKLKAHGLDQLSIATTHNWAGTMDGLVVDERKHIYTPCPAPWSSLSILWDGRVVPCCMDMEAEYVLGDIREQSLKDIYNGQKMRNLRKAIKAGDLQDVSLCDGCHILRDRSYFGIPQRVWTEALDVVRTELGAWPKW